MNVPELLFVYLLGAVGYGGIECLWRGFTHWTMLLLGGVCFVTIYGVTNSLRSPLVWKWLLCAAIITALEFSSGCLLNLYLGWEIWDYGNLSGNLLGQICPFYSACWFLLSIPCSGLAYAIRRWLFRSRPSKIIRK